MNSTIIRLGGLFLLCLGGYFTYSGWATLATEGYYRPKSSFLFPAFAVLGLGMMVFANATLEAKRLAGSQQLSWRDTPMGMKLTVVLAVLAGALNLALISGTI